tara:strand:- start:217 stop:774 length:558 start_codon:yes stop_codon:yes gene_type:complete
MAFWSNVTSEAKRNYRFKITMSPFGQGKDVLWWAKTVSLPSFDVSEIEHNHMDNKYYFPGRVSWSEVSMTLVDPIDPDATDLLNKMLVDSGYVIPGNADKAVNKETISKAKAAGLGAVTIEVLDATGKAIETWELKNPFIKSAKFGELDYSSDDLKQVELTLRYDWATCSTTNGGSPQPKFNAVT